MPVSGSLCPIAAPDRPDGSASAPPSPEGLSYSLTLPAAPHSPSIARTVTRAVLTSHGLEEMADAAIQVVGELTACAYRLAPFTDAYLSLRYRDDALRVIVFDAHPCHTHPRLAAACDARRRAALRLLACVVKSCSGDWGFGDAREPGGGTRMWAVLPRRTSREYTGCHP